MLKSITLLLGVLTFVHGLGQQQCLYFPDFRSTSDSRTDQVVFGTGHVPKHDFVLASSDKGSDSLSILTSSRDNIAVHLAVASFVVDVEKVTGSKLKVYNDTLPGHGKKAVIVGTSGSEVVKGLRGYQGVVDDLEGKWESFDIRVLENPTHELKEAMVISGSDRRGTVFALYDLSEQLGVSPWHYWSDSPPTKHTSIAFNTSRHCSHGEPSVKYRGLFINDELPVLWNWARERFDIPSPEPPFQVGMYEKVFEFVLRMKGNYFWPAMWSSMFSVDGMNVTSGLPSEPLTGANQILADSMGIVMGTSHHEPMGRNKEEWDQGGKGPWDWTNKDVMKKWWEYGAERAKGVETMFTMGMRGDGDSGLEGASKELLEEITDAQREILKHVYDTDDASTISQMWAMYKEVQGYFADGLKVPDDVTILFADDNYGNLMSVKPWEMDHKGGAGIYYHADYVGHPRDYRWMNTNSYAKMWEQLNVAYSFNTTEIWILNVGSMKFLEVPIEWFLNMAWDKERWSRNTHHEFLALLAKREFGDKYAEEIGDILARYSKLAGLMKHELLSPTTYSVINYHELERNIANWTSLEERATEILHHIPQEKKSAYIQLVWMPVSLVTNLNKLHAAVRRNNVYAHQARTSANIEGKKAIEHFEQDFNLSRIFNELEDGKWDHMLDMPHIGYPDDFWHTPQRNSLPPISYIHAGEPSRLGREGIARGQLSNLRFTLENSYGAFPGTNPDSCPKHFDCPPASVYPMDRFGASSRWVDIGSGGPADVEWSTRTNASWLHIEPSKGLIKGDGSTDTRCYLTVDWDKVPPADGDKPFYEAEGAIIFTTSDGTNVSIFAPVINYPSAPHDFSGFIEGDGYVVMEAAHFSKNKSSDGYAYQELVDFGRGLSALEMFPVTNHNFTIGTGPSLRYNFFAQGHTAYENKFEITVQIAPSLNFIIGKQIAFGLQFDDREAKIITPVPTERVPNQGDIGSVPIDWEPTVIQDVRNVTMTVELEEGKIRGEHSVTIWGMSAGIVLERIWVDMGGIKSRGYSLLGPPESKRI